MTKEPINLELRRWLKFMAQASRFMGACKLAEREEREARRCKIIKFPTRAGRDGRA